MREGDTIRGWPGDSGVWGRPRAMLPPSMSEHEQRFELLADLGKMSAGEVELDDLLATFADVFPDGRVYVVSEADIPGRCAAPPAPAMMTWKPSALAPLAKV